MLDVRVARHRNKGVSSTKMQDDLPKSETVDHHDADEWRYSRTADRHGDVYVLHELLCLQRAVHGQLVSQTRYYFSTLLPSLSLPPPFFFNATTSAGARETTRVPLSRTFASSPASALDESFFLQLVVLTPVINPFRLGTGLSGYTLPRSYLD